MCCMRCWYLRTTSEQISAVILSVGYMEHMNPFSLEQDQKQKQTGVCKNPKHCENHLQIGRWKLHAKHITAIWTRAVVLCPPVYTVFVESVAAFESGGFSHVFVADGTFLHYLIIQIISLHVARCITLVYPMSFSSATKARRLVSLLL